MPTAGSMGETGCAAETNLRLALPLSDIPIKLPDDPGWAELAAPYNTRLPFTPAVIVIPKTEDHVRHAVLCAARLGLQVQARSGGHSYASFSIGGRDGAMVIDLRHFQGVSVDQQGIAKVGAGARLGSVAVALLARGRALAHGTCPAVGVGGHATHGGFGMTSRAWGLLLDHIVAMDVVLADGRCVRTSETEHCDLYFVSLLCPSFFEGCYSPSFLGFAWCGRLVRYRHRLLLPDPSCPYARRPRRSPFRPASFQRGKRGPRFSALPEVHPRS